MILYELIVVLLMGAGIIIGGMVAIPLMFFDCPTEQDKIAGRRLLAASVLAGALSWFVHVVVVVGV